MSADTYKDIMDWIEDFKERHCHENDDDLISFLNNAHELQLSDTESDARIFADIIIDAITEIIEIYDILDYRIPSGFYNRIDYLFEKEYSVALIEFLKTIVFDFVAYMYTMNQEYITIYKRQEIASRQQLEMEDDFKDVGYEYSSINNRYNKLKGIYDSAGMYFSLKNSFDEYNNNSTKNKGLLDYEYLLYHYLYEKKSAPKWLKLSKKIENDTLIDEKHYSAKSIIEGINDLEELYQQIVKSNEHSIVKCIALEDIECSYKIEMYYKFLKFFKEKKVDLSSNEVICKIGMLYNFYIDKDFIANLFPINAVPSKTISNDNEQVVTSLNSFLGPIDNIDGIVRRFLIDTVPTKTISNEKIITSLNSFLGSIDEITEDNIDGIERQVPIDTVNPKTSTKDNKQVVASFNSIFWFIDEIPECIDSEREFNRFIDRIIILNLIRDIVLEKLEKKYSSRMQLFDYYNCTELNTFLDSFIGQGQYINYNKDLKNKINIKDMRRIYHEIFFKERKPKATAVK